MKREARVREVCVYVSLFICEHVCTCVYTYVYVFTSMYM